MSGTTTDFELKASEVGQLIQKFKTNVKSMKRMLHYVDNNKESLRQQWSKLKETTSRIARDISTKLKSLQQVQPSKDVEANKRRENLQDEFKTLLDEYEKMLEEAKSKEKLNIEKASVYQSKNRKLSRQEKKEQEMELQVLKSRQQNLDNLATDIQDLDSIFRELGNMVAEQGETVDKIEKATENAALDVEEGTVQIKQAKKSYLKSRKKQALIGAIGLVIVSLVIAYVAYKVSRELIDEVNDGDDGDDKPNLKPRTPNDDTNPTDDDRKPITPINDDENPKDNDRKPITPINDDENPKDNDRKPITPNK